MPTVPDRPIHKHCPRCGVSKILERFPANKSSKDGRLTYCRVCQRQNMKDAIATDKYQRRLAEREALFEHLKDKPCADCGITFPTVCMDFDHRDPATKDFDIARNRHTKLEKLLAEIDKCDVICSNCHRIRTHNQRKKGLIPKSNDRPFIDER